MLRNTNIFDQGTLHSAGLDANLLNNLASVEQLQTKRKPGRPPKSLLPIQVSQSRTQYSLLQMLDPINFIVWNIRGASRIDSLRYLHKFCRDNHVQLVVLLEPIWQIEQLEAVRRHLHFDRAASFLGVKCGSFGTLT